MRARQRVACIILYVVTSPVARNTNLRNMTAEFAQTDNAQAGISTATAAPVLGPALRSCAGTL